MPTQAAANSHPLPPALPAVAPLGPHLLVLLSGLGLLLYPSLGPLSLLLLWLHSSLSYSCCTQVMRYCRWFVAAAAVVPGRSMRHRAALVHLGSCCKIHLPPLDLHPLGREQLCAGQG